MPAFAHRSGGVGMERIKVLYLGGWATSTKGSEPEDPGADLSDYALDQVPKEGGAWVRALLLLDEVPRSRRIRMSSLQRKKTRLIDFCPPLIIPNGDAGHGDEHHTDNLVKTFVEDHIGAIHIEDQRAGGKMCGPPGAKSVGVDRGDDFAAHCRAAPIRHPACAGLDRRPHGLQLRHRHRQR